VDYLKEREVEHYISTEAGEVLGLEGDNVRPLEEISQKVDAVIVIGGDGTILETLQRVDVPVMGINHGTIGYLTEVDPEGAIEAIDAILSGKYTVEEFTRLGVWLNDRYLGDCGNEVVVHNIRVSKMQNFHLNAGGREISFRADGVIISTPMGSTSYALSAGGPVIYSGANVMAIVPIAPFNLSIRPMILPDDMEIKVSLLIEDKEALISLDGQIEVVISPEDRIMVKKAERKSRFIRIDDGKKRGLGDIFHRRM
jgi:NAD+ kinase